MYIDCKGNANRAENKINSFIFCFPAELPPTLFAKEGRMEGQCCETKMPLK